MLKGLFPNSSISSNTVIPSQDIIMKEQDRLRVFEFDVSFTPAILPLLLIETIFLPQLSLAFEYQGEHHYFTNYLGSSEIRQRRDQAKIKFASQLGITLISIPFWWDRSSNSLISTIQYYRPDIVLQSSKQVPPIPKEIPLRFKKPLSTG
jgi:hypothetical protein